jgi:type IV pilus assembly protein PilB
MSLPASSAPGLADRLLSSGLVNATQLDLIGAEHRRRGGAVLDVIADLGLVPPEALAEFMAREAGTVCVNLGQCGPDRDVVDLIPIELARRLRAIPVRLEGSVLTVALADPFNVVAIDTLRQASGFEVDVVTATERDILNALDQVRDGSPTIQQSIEQSIPADAPPRSEPLRSDLEISAVSAGDAPVVQLVNQVISRAVTMGASDIHLEPEERMLRVRLRIDGLLRPDVLIPKALQSAVLARVKILGEMDVTETRVPQDGRASVSVSRRRVNLRISSLPTQFGESVVARILDPNSQGLRLSELGLSTDAERKLRGALEAPHGVVIVTGPTGSGKTTTLYATLTEINRPELSIFTLEDPVEMPLSGIRQTQIREEIGLNFGTALRSLLRQDPDVILVGETRDTETATLMVRAALTGHLVFSTLHTNDAPGAIPRLLDMGVEPCLLPGSLVAVIAQRLVRRLCGKCREPVDNPARSFADLKLPAPTGEPLSLWQARGCSECHHTGYRGRQPIFEILMIDERFHAPIVQRAPHSELARLASEAGMRTMFEDGLRQALRGQTTLSELFQVTHGR